MNDYRKKYLKYKLKYFKKLNMLNQMGGSNSNISKKSKDCCKKTEDHDCCGGHHHYTNLDHLYYLDHILDICINLK